MLAESYRRYIGGESIYSLVLWLNDGLTRPVGGYGVKSDGLWSDRTLRRVLDSGFAAGYITYQGQMLDGAHEPLIDPEEWEAYREARERRRTYRRTERSQYMLSGLVWCQCGSKMHAGQFGTARTPKFRCKDGHEKRKHTGGYVSESILNDAVWEWLTEEEQHLRDLNKLATAEAANLNHKKPAGPSAHSVELKIARIDSKLDSLAERLIDPGIPIPTYTRLRDKYTAERDALEKVKLTSAVEQRVVPLSVVVDLRKQWKRYTIEEKRELLRSLRVEVHVTPGRPKALVRVLANY